MFNLKELINNIQPIVIDSKDAASQLTDEIIHQQFVLFDGITPYIRTKTHWQRIERKDLTTLIRNSISLSCRSKVKSSCIAEAIKRISCDSSLSIDIKAHFNKQKDYINFKNCVFNIRTGHALDNRDKFVFDYVIDADYIPKHQRNNRIFDNFIATSVGDENKECLYRVIGFCLSSITEAKKAVFVTGPPNGGKSCFLRLLEQAVSPELISNVSFSQLSDPHYTMQLLGKRMNISFDNSAKPMDHEELFKSITSCEEISGRELYESPVRFIPTAKLIYASNFPFNFKHPDEALYSRMILIPFENSIPPEKQDKQLLDKLLEERNSIFSNAADTLRELINSNYDFRMSAKGKEYLHNRITILHSSEDFLDEKTVIDEKGTVSKADLLTHYEGWCKDNALKPVVRTEFAEHVLAYHPLIKCRKIGPREKRVWGYDGIRLKTSDDYEDKSKQLKHMVMTSADGSDDRNKISQHHYLTNKEEIL